MPFTLNPRWVEGELNQVEPIVRSLEFGDLLPQEYTVDELRDALDKAAAVRRAAKPHLEGVEGVDLIDHKDAGYYTQATNDALILLRELALHPEVSEEDREALKTRQAALQAEKEEFARRQAPGLQAPLPVAS